MGRGAWWEYQLRSSWCLREGTSSAPSSQPGAGAPAPNRSPSDDADDGDLISK